MSLIMKNLGKLTTNTTQNTDINNDSITDVVDYSLALYSLKNNAVDDVINLTAPIQPTVTLQPTATPSITPTPAPTRTPTPTPTLVHTSNPFGVMISGDTNQIKTQTALKLGAVYYRPISVFLDKWTATCGECDAAVSGGLRLALTIRANGGGPGIPTTPPTDWDNYKNVLSQVVDKYKPEILIIENEENSAALFYNGTTQQYLEELRVGCQVAHQKGIKCSNGGLVSKLVVILVSQSYQPNASKADDYLKRALTPEDYNSVVASIGSSVWLSQIQKGQDLLAGYRSSGADFVNFHWYQANMETLSEAVSYLKTSSGLPAITNEVGQQGNTDPIQVSNVMKKIVELRLPYAVWFSMDTNPPDGARALNETNGTLRSNGDAYAQFIKGNF